MIQNILTVLNEYKLKAQKEATIFALLYIGLSSKQIVRLMSFVASDYIWDGRTFFNRRLIIEKILKGEEK